MSGLFGLAIGLCVVEGVSGNDGGCVFGGVPGLGGERWGGPVGVEVAEPEHVRDQTRRVFGAASPLDVEAFEAVGGGGEPGRGREAFSSG